MNADKTKSIARGKDLKNMGKKPNKELTAGVAKYQQDFRDEL